MNRVLWTFALLTAFLIAALPGVARAGADCAFVDKNDNKTFEAGTDDAVTDAQWLGGTAFITPFPFVVPANCLLPDLTALKAPLYGVMVVATKITFLGTLNYVPPGGKGVALIAIAIPGQPGDGSVTIGNGVATKVRISAGGYTVLPTNAALLAAGFPAPPTPLPLSPAIPKKSVSIYASGACSIKSSEVRGNRPDQDTMVGVLCESDVTISDAVIIGSGVNIQSRIGKIDASSNAVSGPNLASACDDPVLNLLGTGNNDGVPDFPCKLNLAGVGVPPGISPIFNDAAELEAFCKEPGAGPNVIQAHNDPLIMIANKLLDLHGVSSNKTDVAGRFSTVLASEIAGINTSNAHIWNWHNSTPAPGGAFIYLFASPTSIVRVPTEREHFFGFSGLGGATTDITNACYESPNPIQVGERSNLTLPLTGVPVSTSPCRTDFVGIKDKLF